MFRPVFTTEDAAFATDTEQPTFRHWTRIAREENLDIGTSDPRPLYDEYDIAVFAIVRALVSAGLPVYPAFNFAIHVVAEYGMADPEQSAEWLWTVWEDHEIFLVNRQGVWGLHDVKVEAKEAGAAYITKPDENLYLALRPAVLIREAITRARQSLEARKMKVLERFGT